MYYMISDRAGDVSYWQPCKATTLLAAKREAAREYGDGYLDATIRIAEGDDVTEPRHILATKANRPSARWINADSVARDGAERVRDYRRRKAAAGEEEVRGIFLPRRLHKRLKDYARRLR